MGGATGTTLAAATALTVEQAADFLEALAGAGRLLASELDDITASTGAVSASTVTRLENLAAALRPAARIRAQLSALGLAQLEAAAALWKQRRARAEDEASADLLAMRRTR